MTDAEEAQGHLDPWIQWITVHTGLAFAEHHVFKLGDGQELAAPTIADLVARAGEEAWLCGPMNVVPIDPIRGWWLPDPWNPASAPVPNALADFATFVRANVQEHTNVSARLSPSTYLRFLAFMLRHGLSRSTIGATLRQLIGERTGRAERWQRAALLDRFQWDLFRWHLRRARPALSTLFSNTTAHYQHVYWRYMDPEPFSNRPDEADRARLGGAILAGYREMDRLVGRALDLVDDETTLVLCTALSQQPYTLMEAEGGKHIYRPHRVADLLGALGVVGIMQIAPVMAEQFHVYFATEGAAATAEELLATVVADGLPAFGLRRAGTDLFVGCKLVHEVSSDAVLEVPGTGVRLAFYDHLYRSETAKSGYHHPEGAFWVRTRDRAGLAVTERVPLRSVAPTLLRLLDIEVPGSMRAPALPTSIQGVDPAHLPRATPAA